jgi:ionotropic glutamate receptor/U3 small nucleolar RNA-associated protein 19
MAHNDVSKMEAIVPFVDFFFLCWREFMVVYVDNIYGKNGVSTVRDALTNLGLKITNKKTISPGAS